MTPFCMCCSAVFAVLVIVNADIGIKEAYSKSECADTSFLCSNGLCVGKWRTCDGDNDCGDWSDETNCTYTQGPCLRTRFRCSNGRCIDNKFVCDNNNTCGDWSDESNCNITPSTFSSTPAPSNCSFGDLRCSNGRCINTSNVCNGNNDCGDWTDEYDCNIIRNETRICRLGTFQCWNGRCINFDWICDGYDDCDDGSDEIRCGSSCPTAIPDCRPGRFQCWNGRCINFNWVCDGYDDCNDGSDEIRCGISEHLTVVQNPNLGVIIGIMIGLSLLVIITGIVCLRSQKRQTTAGNVIASSFNTPWQMPKGELSASPAP